MRKAFKVAGILAGGLVVLALGAILVSGGVGYIDARSDADQLRARADALIAQGRGADQLSARQREILLAVEDPNFAEHSGVDFSTPGAGLTTITQSASKRLGFDKFRPGFGKIRQTGYALGLESKLTKKQILALWLDTLEMGKGPDGWMVGFHNASTVVYGRPAADLSEAEFIRLVAVLIAPAAYDLFNAQDDKLSERSARIERLVAGACSPAGFSDVWLDGCAQPAQ
ncbi:Multimodular transpeptidase-transglycosylase [Hyphomicrobium sulfonivorans]|uniref:Multimodular transpeptidase-transglycosylase n=1 Tax=Hyphomicrobium sulfonivorans TaxID=121290 RepID=A0A109BDQ0_HYPSL|nr:transglycosylase domain-containing protein [Hyphomicrobium sulfonivorans]KWT66302.1 Multimodular transpeptidase-transglycosylase [Hyphomicrobium sulfonivorans]